MQISLIPAPGKWLATTSRLNLTRVKWVGGGELKDWHRNTLCVEFVQQLFTVSDPV